MSNFKLNYLEYYMNFEYQSIAVKLDNSDLL